MYRVDLTSKAEQDLTRVKNNDEYDHNKILNCLQELEERGLTSDGVKGIGDDIYRKRVMRRRILFTKSKKEKFVFDVWLIEIEKDTNKDYDRRKKYIIQEIRNRNKTQ